MLVHFVLLFLLIKTDRRTVDSFIDPTLLIMRPSIKITVGSSTLRYLHLSYKKLSYRRGTARCVVSIEILPIATQQCRNYLYDKSWPNRWYEVGDLVGGNAWWTMCTQPWRDRVGSHCLRCHKQNDDGPVVYITCIPTTCCGEIL